MVDRRNCCSHFSSHRSDRQILAENRDFCLPRLYSTPQLERSCRNIAITFGTEKLEWWLLDGEKCEDMFIHFDRVHERDRRTDRRTYRQTPHDGIGRAYTRQKLYRKNVQTRPGAPLDTLNVM